MHKRLLSLILVLVLAFAAVPQYGVLAASYPYTETDDFGNVTYHRLSNGKDVAFVTDYDEMVRQVRTSLISHSENIDYYFATTDSTYAYTYASESDIPDARKVANSLYAKLMNDVFEIGSQTATSGGGEYLYNSIINIGGSGEDDGVIYIGDTGINFLLTAGDTPVGDNERYYTFHFSWENIQYYTTPEQERMTDMFASWFSSNYLSADMTEYQKVKTIYDFIVRNTVYDWNVYRRNSEESTEEITAERYNIAHSAFGAIYGNILDSVNDGTVIRNMDSVFASKLTVTGEKVPVLYNQGMAVCEGYSKLFYYLCIYNGIRCHIVDGDYIAESGRASDPHEWNYVYLMDESGDGYKWFQVDCTKSSQNSVKEIDVNNYNYFLCGYESVYLGWKNHQEAYENKGVGYKEQLYDWYDDANRSSKQDYVFSKVRINESNMSQGYIVRRTTFYDEHGEERNSYIFCDKDGYKLVEVNEEGIVLTDTEGFVYTGYTSTFSVVLPYLVNRTNVLDNGTVSEGEYTMPQYVTDSATGENYTSVKNTGDYYITIEGTDGTSLVIPFDIVARNMSKEAIEPEAVVLAYDRANYTGKAIKPSLSITDPYKNTLTETKDYTVHYYYNGTEVSEIKEIGEYEIRIVYQGNYRGTYSLDFSMNGIDLGILNYSENSFSYIPEYFRNQEGYTDPAAYYKRGVKNGLRVGTITIYPDVDFSVSSTGNLEYGSKGKIKLTGLANSNVVEGTSLTTEYSVDKKYDISSFDGKVADTNTVNKVYYTGRAVTPIVFDSLDKYLVQGKDYKITGYSNNVEVGYAYVNIEGIGGCSGKASLKFYINPPQNLVKPTATGNQFKLAKTSYVYDGKVKKPAVVFKNSAGKTVDPYYYTVSYTANKNVGTATAVITLRNGWSGTVKLSFTVLPKGTAVSKLTAAKKAFTAKWAKQTAQTTGYQLQYSTNKKFKSAKTVAITKNTTVSKVIKKLSSKKIYYVRLRTYKTVGGKKYYSAWSAAKAVKTK